MSEEQEQRYYCHQCNATCVPQPPQFLCPTCNEGFIEPVAVPPLSRPSFGIFPTLPDSVEVGGGDTQRGEGGAAGRDPFDALRTMHTLLGTEMLLTSPLLQRARARSARQQQHPTTSSSGEAGRPSPPTTSSSTTSSTTTSSTTTPNNDVSPNRATGHSHRIHSSNVNPNSGVLGGHSLLLPGRAGGIRFVLGDSGDGNTDIPTLFSMIMAGINGDGGMVGNPGDYAWGPTGLDNIISQLIGQLDGSGPPPAQEESIDLLPEVYVPKKYLANKLDCTVCQEYFTEDVKVKELPCQHYFHIDCIVPWLKLHNSCPICRVSIDTTPPDVDMSGEGSTLYGQHVAEEGSTLYGQHVAGEGSTVPDSDAPTPTPAEVPAPQPPSQPAPVQQPTSQPQTIHEDDLD